MRGGEAPDVLAALCSYDPMRERAEQVASILWCGRLRGDSACSGKSRPGEEALRDG